MMNVRNEKTQREPDYEFKGVWVIDRKSTLHIGNFSIECSKTKPKLLQRPIRQKENIFKSQRELKVETDQPVQSAGKRERPSNDWFFSLCIRSVELVSFLDQTPSEVMQKQNNPELFLTLN